MALAPSDAFDFAKIYVKNSRLDDVKVRILDDVNKYMWMAAPWRWTIGSMPDIVLAANTQDYPISKPADFLFLQEAYVIDGSTAPRPLIVEATLPTLTRYVGQPSRVAVVGSTVRISPVPGSFTGNLTNHVVSEYKIVAPDITSGNAGTPGAQVFPDSWFWVYQAGVLWRSYLYADDDRAGNVTFAEGKVQYTGLRADFEAGLQTMRQTEKITPEKQVNN